MRWKSPGTIESQGQAGNRLDEGQADGDNRKECFRNKIIGRDDRGEGLGIEEFDDAAVDK